MVDMPKQIKPAVKINMNVEMVEKEVSVSKMFKQTTLEIPVTLVKRAIVEYLARNNYPTQAAESISIEPRIDWGGEEYEGFSVVILHSEA